MVIRIKNENSQHITFVLFVIRKCSVSRASGCCEISQPTHQTGDCGHRAGDLGGDHRCPARRSRRRARGSGGAVDSPAAQEHQPRGFPLGVVATVEKPAYGMFKDITIDLAASADVNETVFVVTSLGAGMGLTP